MTPKETLLKQIENKEVTLLSQVDDKFIIRYLGLMWLIVFDAVGNVNVCNPKDIDDGIYGPEIYLPYIDKFNHSFVVVDDFFKILYIEPKDPQPWMDGIIDSIPEFWWAIYRHRTDVIPDDGVAETIGSLPSTKFYTRTLMGEPVLVPNPNFTEVTLTVS